jgi:hypothetical protein
MKNEEKLQILAAAAAAIEVATQTTVRNEDLRVENRLLIERLASHRDTISELQSNAEKDALIQRALEEEIQRLTARLNEITTTTYAQGVTLPCGCKVEFACTNGKTSVKTKSGGGFLCEDFNKVFGMRMFDSNLVPKHTAFVINLHG